MALTEDKPQPTAERHSVEKQRDDVSPGPEQRIIEARSQDHSTSIQISQASEAPHWRRRRWLIPLIALVVIGSILGGTSILIDSRTWVSTDDAFIDTHIAQVSAQVAGRVKTVLVNDNERVAAGQPLVELD